MTAEEIAAKLPPAKRKWLPTFRDEPFAGRAIGMSKATLRALIADGLVEEHRPQFFGMIKWNLTPLGQQVRSILEGTSHAD